MKATIRLSPDEVTSLVRAHINKIACLNKIVDVNVMLDSDMGDNPIFEGVAVEVELSEV